MSVLKHWKRRPLVAFCNLSRSGFKIIDILIVYIMQYIVVIYTVYSNYKSFCSIGCFFPENAVAGSVAASGT